MFKRKQIISDLVIKIAQMRKPKEGTLNSDDIQRLQSTLKDNLSVEEIEWAEAIYSCLLRK